MDGSKAPEIAADVRLDHIMQKECFEDRESNDSDYHEEPWEEVYEHHYIDKVSPGFSLL